MKRRTLVALVAVGVVTVLGLLVTGSGVYVTRTRAGQEQLRRYVERRVAGALNGTVRLGRISGSWLTGVTVDTLEIRAPDGSLLLSSGPVVVDYDPRDLLDRRVLLRRLELTRPFLHLRQYEDGSWNYRKVLDRARPKGPRGPERRFGDFVVASGVRVHDGHLVLTLPWHADDSLTGPRRDSAERHNVARRDREIRRDGPFLTRSWHWRQLQARASYLRYADPDSVGRLYVFDTLHAVESDPPFRWRNVAMRVQHRGDTAWLDVPHLELAGSRGRAKGTVVWGGGLPNRYAIRVEGDTLSMADVAWVYPTLPRTGGGRMTLDIRNDASNLKILEYALSNLDVRSTDSRLRGRVTFALGGPVLGVKDVAVRAEPVDFALLRTLNGKPFPVDWRGSFSGTVRARGGAVNRFVVDQADLVFRDAHVPGAVSRVRGRGELDILLPAFTTFRGFDVETDRVDLRTIQHLYPNFPALGGTFAGRATLDSSWLDVRFSRADVTHRNGPGAPTRVTGEGRATSGAQFMTYDVALRAEPLSMEQLARAYPALRIAGLFSGPIRVRGTAEQLDIDATLEGAAGRIAYRGVVDGYAPGFAARGVGEFSSVDPRALVTVANLPDGALAGRYELDLTFDSLANARGRTAFQLDRSVLGGLRLFPSRAALRFADGRLLVDTLLVESVAASLIGRGAVGLPGGVRDSLRLTLLVDSLGGLRRYLTTPATVGDTLAGAFRVDAVLAGRLDDATVVATATGSELAMPALRARRAVATGRFTGLPSSPRGTLVLGGDTLVVAGVRLHRADATVQMASAEEGRFEARLAGDVVRTAQVGGSLRVDGDTSRFTVDTLTLALTDDVWQLRAASTLAVMPAGLTLDTLVLESTRGGRVALGGTLPTQDSVRLFVAGHHVPVAQVGRFAGVPPALQGLAGFVTTIGGTRAAPVVRGSITIDSVRYGNAAIDSVRASLDYANRQLDTRIAVTTGGRQLGQLDLALPIDLALVPVTRRLGTEPLRGVVRAEHADLGIVEALAPGVRGSKGTLDADVAVGGTWTRPSLRGPVTVRDGELDVVEAGVRLRRIDIALDFAGDTLVVRRASAVSLGDAEGSASLVGRIGYADLFAERPDAALQLRVDARSFRALDRRSLARLDVSTGTDGVQLRGRLSGATLMGELRVDRGSIFLPDRELARKQLVDLSGEQLESLIDTADSRNRSIIPRPPSRLVENLSLSGVRITLGDEVWLRSREANVKLSGSLNVTRTLATRGEGASRRRTFGEGPRYQLALDGTLTADRGTYTLNFGEFVQREFRVESGAIRFYGTTADFNPEVDISALYRVKQRGQQDIRVRARIVGFYPRPVLQLSSAENYALSTSDLVSYLVTGAPSFELGDDAASRLGTAGSFILPTLGTAVGGVLRRGVGWLDQVQFEAGATSVYGEQTQTGDLLGDFFANARVGGEKQVRENLYFSFSAGLCQLSTRSAGLEEQQQGFFGFADALGGRVEYRLPDNVALQFAWEPPASALRCGTSQVRGLVPTPRQIGLSALRSWKF